MPHLNAKEIHEADTVLELRQLVYQLAQRLDALENNSQIAGFLGGSVTAQELLRTGARVAQIEETAPPAVPETDGLEHFQRAGATIVYRIFDREAGAYRSVTLA